MTRVFRRASHRAGSAGGRPRAVCAGSVPERSAALRKASLAGLRSERRPASARQQWDV